MPVLQSFLSDVGLFAGRIQWGLGPLVPLAWLFPIEAVFLYLGACGSLIVAFQIARVRQAGLARGRVAAAAAPWIVLCVSLLACGLWILVQPMDMRGTLMLVGPAGR